MSSIQLTKNRPKFIYSTIVFTGAMLLVGAMTVTGLFQPAQAQEATQALPPTLRCERAFHVRETKTSPTPTPPICTRNVPIDITFVIDHSGSMARRILDFNCNGQQDVADGDRIEDLRQLKLERVKQATTEVINSVFAIDTNNSVRFGAIKFANCDQEGQEKGTRILSPLVGKEGQSALVNSINSLNIPINVNDWNTGNDYRTCTHEGLNIAADQARMGNRQDAKQIVILLTDGRPYHTANPNDPRNRSVMEKMAIESAVNLGLKNYGSANSNGVKVVTVGVGDPLLPVGGKVCGWDPLKAELMACMGGVYDQDGDGNYENNYTIPSYGWDGFPVAGPTLSTQCRPDRRVPGTARLANTPEQVKDVLNDVVKEIATENCVGNAGSLNNILLNRLENVSAF